MQSEEGLHDSNLKWGPFFAPLPCKLERKSNKEELFDSKDLEIKRFSKPTVESCLQLSSARCSASPEMTETLTDRRFLEVR